MREGGAAHPGMTFEAGNVIPISSLTSKNK